jgi:DNA-binding XRE family transcriptional regulator
MLRGRILKNEIDENFYCSCFRDDKPDDWDCCCTQYVGITQAELGKLSGIPITSVCTFETGRRTPSLESFRRLCVALGVSADYLLGINIAELWGME